MGEPSGWNRNLRNGRMAILMNLASLALNAGSGPGGDIPRKVSSHKGSRDQLSGRTNTRVRKVV